MAHFIEHELTKKFAPYTNLTVLEVGAASESSKTLRGICDGSVYFGLDQQDGRYVNVVHDLENPLPGHFGEVDVVLCYSVLEHSPQPWLLAKNIQSIMKKGGLLLLSVPFSFKYHAHPKDYYRFTFDAIEFLFPDIEFIDQSTWPKESNLLDHPREGIFLLSAGRKR